MGTNFLDPRFILLALVSLSFSNLEGAEDKYEEITTVSGKVYRSVSVLKVEPDGVKVLHSSGIAKIPFTELSAEFSKKYGYDVTKADEFIKKREAERLRKKKIAELEARKKAVYSVFTSEINSLKRGNFDSKAKARVKVLQSKLNACRAAFIEFEIPLSEQKEYCRKVYNRKISIGIGWAP